MKIEQNEIPCQILDRNIAIIGFGPIAQAIALCLRDSGHEVTIGLRSDSQSIKKAESMDFAIAHIEESVAVADAILLLIPDDKQGDVFNEQISSHMRKDSILVLAHGYSFLYDFIKVPTGIDAVVIAPHGPGKALRELYLAEKGLAAEVAIHVDSSGNAKSRALSLCRSLGFDKGGIRMTSVREEVVMDNFSEQMVLCGGIVELMRAAYKILVDAGYDSESAYESIVRELKYTVDIIHESGPDGLYRVISRSALVGSIISGKLAIGDDVSERMKNVLKMIETGEFHKKLMELSSSERLSELEREIERLKNDFQR